MSLEEQYKQFKEFVVSLSEKERKEHVESCIRDAIDSGALVAFRLILEARLLNHYSGIKGADQEELCALQARIKETTEVLELLNRGGAYIKSKAVEDTEYYIKVNKRFLIPDGELANVDAG